MNTLYYKIVLVKSSQNMVTRKVIWVHGNLMYYSHYSTEEWKVVLQF